MKFASLLVAMALTLMPVAPTQHAAVAASLTSVAVPLPAQLPAPLATAPAAAEADGFTPTPSTFALLALSFIGMCLVVRRRQPE